MSDRAREDAQERRFQGVGARIDEELGRVVCYMNDEIVPDVRHFGLAALHAAASELRRLAARLDAIHARVSPVTEDSRQ